MIGHFDIDGIDAYATYGALLGEGAFAALVAMPSLKGVLTQEWAESDGVAAMLANPRLEARELQLPIIFLTSEGAIRFLSMLKGTAQHYFKARGLDNRAWTLRMVKNGTDTVLGNDYGKARSLTLTMAEDAPTMPEDRSAFVEAGEVNQDEYVLDGTPLADLGIWVLEGSDESIRKMADIRQGLTWEEANWNGRRYDNAHTMKEKGKNITLKMHIHTSTVRQFWERYDTLFYRLMQAGERLFYHTPTGTRWRCYYNGMNVTSYVPLPNGAVWCQFDVTLAVTGRVDDGESGVVLGTEDDMAIEMPRTMAGEYMMINMTE